MATNHADNFQQLCSTSSCETGVDQAASPISSDHYSIQTVSTATYERQEQEAERNFQRRIEQLCQDLWPAPRSMKYRLLTSNAAMRLRSSSLIRSIIPAPQTLSITHLKGGGFNYITAVTLPPTYSAEGYRHLILRIPREAESRPDHQVATLQYVQTQTSIPVPSIKAADFTCDNALEKPYTIQHRVPGSDLDSIWETLTHFQRCNVAEEVGKVVRKLLSVESQSIGLIQAASEGSDTSLGTPHIVPWRLESRGEALELKPRNALSRGAPSVHNTTLNFFESYFECWRGHALSESLGEVDVEVQLYDDLLQVSREMNELSLFEPNLNCLCHLDLHPRNIMVQLGRNSSVEITAILDWDETVIAPNLSVVSLLAGYGATTKTLMSMRMT